MCNYAHSNGYYSNESSEAIMSAMKTADFKIVTNAKWQKHVINVVYLN